MQAYQAFLGEHMKQLVETHPANWTDFIEKSETCLCVTAQFSRSSTNCL